MNRIAFTTNLRRVHRRLASFADSAILITLFLATVSSALIACSRGAGTSPSITDTEFAKLKAVFGPHGYDQTLYKPTTDALGLTKGNQALKVRQIGTVAQGITFVISPLPDDKGYLFGTADKKVAHAYWVDKNLFLIAGVVKSPNQPPEAMALSDATAGLNQVLTFWASFADRL